MSTDKIGPIISNGVVTIGRKDLIPKGIITVRWSWTDDEGQLQTNKFNNVLQFIDSTFNILIATALVEFMKGGDGTWVLTKIKYSIFTWNFGKYKKTKSHS